MNSRLIARALVLVAVLCACEAPGEKSAQEALAKVRVLRASGNSVATVKSAHDLVTGYPDTRAARAAKKIEEEVQSEITAELQSSAEKMKKEQADREAREQRISAKIAASRELLATLSSKTDDMAHVTWYKAKGDDLVLGSWIRFYFGISSKTGTSVLMPLRTKIHLEDSEWVFARKAVFKVDGKMFDVHDDNWQHSNYGGTVWEAADVPLSEQNPDLMNALAQSKDVKVRFEGRERVRDVTISARQLSMLKQVFAVWHEINAQGESM